MTHREQYAPASASGAAVGSSRERYKGETQ
jgi:hypothetical protein